MVKEVAKWDYLRYLARVGQSYIHPGGSAASHILQKRLGFTAGDRVLEIGCGTGATLADFAQIPQISLTGIEALPEMMATARRRLKSLCKAGRVRLIFADFAKWPSQHSAFEKIYCESVLCLQGEAKLKEIMAKVFALLVPGGLFGAVETIWKKTTPVSTVAAQNKAFQLDFGLSLSTPMAWSEESWLKVFTQSGFEVVANELWLEPDQQAQLEAGNDSSRPSLAFRVGRRFRTSLLFAQELHYRKLLRQHAGQSQWVETRFFLVKKPVEF